MTKLFGPAAFAALLALTPAAALASLHVSANGFDRVVTSSTTGRSCHVYGPAGAKIVRCPDGSRGTMLMYRHFRQDPACQLDFWFAPSSAGGGSWHADLSRRNATIGTCSLHWNDRNSIDVGISP